MSLKAEFSFDDPMANSSQLSLPKVTMPAWASLVTTVASKGDRYPANIFEPAVVTKSRVTKISLCASGTPSKLPAVPAASRASDARAWASVTSGCTSKKAPRPVCALARPRKCWANSVADTFFARIRSASCDTVKSCNSEGVEVMCIDVGRIIQSPWEPKTGRTRPLARCADWFRAGSARLRYRQANAAPRYPSRPPDAPAG
jgi:hypothetical protein